MKLAMQEDGHYSQCRDFSAGIETDNSDGDDSREMVYVGDELGPDPDEPEPADLVDAGIPAGNPKTITT